MESSTRDIHSTSTMAVSGSMFDIASVQSRNIGGLIYHHLIVPPGIMPPPADMPGFSEFISAAFSIYNTVVPLSWNILLTMPFDISTSISSVSHVSAKDCIHESPSSQQSALDPSHHDRLICAESSAEEKQSLLDIDTYPVIMLNKYHTQLWSLVIWNTISGASTNMHHQY
jgi:hypothetical protein